MTITPAATQLNQTFWFKMDAWPRKQPGNNDSHTFGVVIPQVAGFEIRVWDPPTNIEYLAIPPSTVTIRFALYNKGNGMDRFLVSGESTRADAGWTLSFASGIDEFGFTPDLPADPHKVSPHFIDVKVQVPAGERAHVTAHVTMTAVSMFNVTKQMPPAFAKVTSLQCYNFQVYVIGPDNQEGTPGQEVEFQLKIANRGNGWDTFSIRPVWDKALNIGFIASANPRSVEIDLGENGTVQYIVKVPSDAPKETYFFTAEIQSSSPELAPVTRSFAVEVGQFYAIEMEAPIDEASTTPGGTLEFEVTVRNTGNGLDSIVIQEIVGAPSTWLRYTQPPEVTLLQDQEAVVKVIVIVPSKFEEAPIGSYTLTVPAKSSRSEAVAEVDLLIDINQSYRVEWYYQGEPLTSPVRPVAPQGIMRPLRSMNPYERDFIDFTLEVKNLGNGEDNIEIGGHPLDPRITVEVTPAYTLLDRDQVKYVKVHIQVPEDLAPGVYSVLASVSSHDVTFPLRVVPFEFEIENYDASTPAVPTYIETDGREVVRSELNVRPSRNLSFKMRIENTGTRSLSAVTVEVTDVYYDEEEVVDEWTSFNFSTPPIAVGDRFIVGERPFTPANPPLHWWSDRSGKHTLEFRLSYPDQSDVSNDVSTLNVTVENADADPPDLDENAYLMAAVDAVVIAVGYVSALRRRPQVDTDLYGSIYGGDLEGWAVEGVRPAQVRPSALSLGPRGPGPLGRETTLDGCVVDDVLELRVRGCHGRLSLHAGHPSRNPSIALCYPRGLH